VEEGPVTLNATAATAPGTLRQEIVVAGRHRLVTDQPVAAGGGDAGPSPHELFAAALAGCVSVTLAAYARTKGWDLGEIRVDVEYDHRSTPRRCTVAAYVDAELTEEMRSRLAKVAAACPLRRSIDTGFEFDERVVGRREAA
jgi:putative redox protein